MLVCIGGPRYLSLWLSFWSVCECSCYVGWSSYDAPFYVLLSCYYASWYQNSLPFSDASVFHDASVNSNIFLWLSSDSLCAFCFVTGFFTICFVIEISITRVHTKNWTGNNNLILSHQLLFIWSLISSHQLLSMQSLISFHQLLSISHLVSIVLPSIIDIQCNLFDGLANFIMLWRRRLEISQEFLTTYVIAWWD